jgi:hypothetical protein
MMRIAHAVAAGITLLCASTAAAQRPAPPKDWTIDTVSTPTTVLATRKGGVMSTATEGTLIGPYLLGATDPLRLLEDEGRVDASRVGQLDESGQGDARRDDMINGRRVLSRAWTVRTSTGAQRYLAYRLTVPRDSSTPVWLLRLAFGDAITMVRVLRSGFDALEPYAQSPTAAMRTVPARPAASIVATSSDVAAPSNTPPTGAPSRAQGSRPMNESERRHDALARGVIDYASREAARNASLSPVRMEIGTAVEATPVAVGGSRPIGGNYAFRFAYRAGGVAGVYVFVPYLLRNDGIAIEAPDVPPDEFDETAARRARPDDFLRWSRGRGDTVVVIDRRGERDTWTPSELFPALPARSGQRIEAVYKATSSFSTPDMSTSVVSASNVIVLRADGTFSTDRAVMGSGSSGSGSVVAGSSGTNSGTYSLDGHVITFRFRDGKTQRQVFFINQKNGQQDLTIVCIGGRTYIADRAR